MTDEKTSNEQVLNHIAEDYLGHYAKAADDATDVIEVMASQGEVDEGLVEHYREMQEAIAIQRSGDYARGMSRICESIIRAPTRGAHDMAGELFETSIEDGRLPVILGTISDDFIQGFESLVQVSGSLQNALDVVFRSFFNHDGGS